jgi:hypothetical protein
MRWTLHKGSLMRYDYMDESAGVVRITEFWPKLGEQHFAVRRYSDGRGEQEVAHESRSDFASAIQLAEEWLPGTYYGTSLNH